MKILALHLACSNPLLLAFNVLTGSPPQYETPSEDVRRIFEEHGEIKTFFDLISTRGMVFVTYVSEFC
jgi:hypothetical protein